jgi:hypothetical protein
MSTTNNKNLSEPNYGDTNWNVPLNNNFTYIDQGLGSTFPVYVGTGGTTTLSTGTATISGVSWYNAQQLTVVSGTSGSPANLASDATISIANNISGTANTLGGSWIIRNTLSTTQQGIYHVYVKVTGSSTTVEVPNGTSLYVYTDGTTIRLVDDGALQSVNAGSFSTLKSDSTTNLNINSGVTTIGWQLPFTVTITNATPTVIGYSTTVSPNATLPSANTPVYFQTTGSLPSGVTANTTYYVLNPSFSSPNGSFNISPYYGGSLAANQVAITTASPAVITNADNNAPQAGTSVVFTTTGALPTGLTAGSTYYVANPSGKTYNVSASSSLTPLVATTANGYGISTATFGTTLINTTTSGSGTHTIFMGTTAQLNIEGSISFTLPLQAAGDPGATGQFLQSKGSSAPPIWAAVGQTVLDYQPFSATGTWTKPAGATGDDIVMGFIWGGGGGGSGAGGGGGACTQFWYKSSDLSASETVTIGAGGAAGAAGGQSSFATNNTNAVVRAYGGGGGGPTNSTTGGGGGGGGSLGAGGAGSSYQTTNADFPVIGGQPAIAPSANQSSAHNPGFGGGAGGIYNGAGFNSAYGGGGGGGYTGSSGAVSGGQSLYGGGGGGGRSNVGTGGGSVFGGSGGAGSQNASGAAGSIPSGGGGGSQNAGGAGARGQARIWTIRAVAG